MVAEYEGQIDQEYLVDEQVERGSDIPLPPIIDVLLFIVWVVISLIGFGVIFLAKQPIAGAAIIGIPTFIGMVIKPTFALCIMMLVLPTGAGIGYRQIFSLDRGVGVALAAAFVLNYLVTRPRLRLGNKALWVVCLYTLWVVFALVGAPYFKQELERTFTVVQLLAITLIAYWIIGVNGERTFRWALRAFVIGTLGTILLAHLTGAAMETVEEAVERRYAATIVGTVDANMLSTLTAMAFFAAMYLFVRDKSIIWRVMYVATFLVVPPMMLKIGSRGGMVAFIFTVLSPFLFIRQVLRRPGLALILLVVILVGLLSAVLVVKSGGLEMAVVTRLTDVYGAGQAISYRMEIINKAIEASTRSLTGTGYYGWYGRAGIRHIPHNDFFIALGIYGIPAAVMFAVFLVLMMLTVKRIAFGPEKIYTRAVLTFLLVMGLNVPQIYTKHFWVFLAMVMAIEELMKYRHLKTDDSIPDLEYQETLTPHEQLV
jgi:hypothetical protein